jgi:hypothetical protein
MSDARTGPDATARELGKEYPPAAEEAVLEELRALHLKVQNAQPGGAMRRGEHPKQHAGLWARLRVESDLPAPLRRGLFAEPRSYTALVRYSNGRAFDDRLPDVHGMAVKVLLPRPGEDGGAPLQQDFILADHPVFFARNVQHIYDFLLATATGTPASQLAMTTHPQLVHFTSEPKSSPAAMTFWSQTPYRLGDGAVKYVATPSESEEMPAIALGNSPDCLREALVEQLGFRKIGAHFDLSVIPQTDPLAMPIEDPTVEWASAPVRVATIDIYPQTFDSTEQMAFFESLSWTPWNALPEHAPLGGINRARRLVYEDSSGLRHRTSGVAPIIPTGRETF